MLEEQRQQALLERQQALQAGSMGHDAGVA